MDKDEFRELVEQGYEISEMAKTPGWYHLTEFVQRIVDAENRWLLDGHAENVEEYRAKAGYIQGIKLVLGAPDRFQTRVDAERKRQAA